MSSVRREYPAGPTQPSYDDTGEFADAVSRLADPLSDPLPGYQPAGSGPGPEAEAEGSPWFRPATEQAGQGQAGGGAGYGTYGTHGGSSAPSYEPAQDQWQSHDMYAQPYPPAYEPVTAPEPAPEPALAPERVPPPRRARATGGMSGVSETAPLPLLESGSAPGDAGTPGAPGAARADDPPVPGGRAARRKAAKRGGARRAASSAPVTGATTATPPRSRMEARRAARAAKEPPMVVASRITGEVFITIGALMLLFVVYQLWWTNILADQAANGAANNLKHQWAGSSSATDAKMPDHFAPGQTFAIIYLPKLDVEAPIAEGVDKTTILDKGEVGHYSGQLETAFPWDTTGNFALAGHRNTHGEPFRYINKLVPGDKVVVETSSTYYTYEVTSTLPQTSPTNISVIQPVPPGSGFNQPGRYITLTTCTPEFTSLYRLVVWGKMIDEEPRSKGTPAALGG